MLVRVSLSPSLSLSEPLSQPLSQSLSLFLSLSLLIAIAIAVDVAVVRLFHQASGNHGPQPIRRRLPAIYSVVTGTYGYRYRYLYSYIKYIRRTLVHSYGKPHCLKQVQYLRHNLLLETLLAVWYEYSFTLL